VAICKTCDKKYSKWTTPVSARGICSECFKVELGNAPELTDDEGVIVREYVPMPSVLMTRKTIPERRMVPIRLCSFLPRSRSKIVFALVMGCYCIALGSLMSVSTWVARTPRPPREFYLRGDVRDVFALLMFAPLIESLMLIGVFELVRRVRAPVWIQVVTSALFISELHVWPWWPHPFIVLPSFLIQSASYSYWRRRSWKAAYWVVVCIHFTNNVIPTLSAVGRFLRHA